MGDFFSHLALVGLPAALAPTVLLLISLRWARAAFATDYPTDIQATMPEFSRAERVRSWFIAAAFLIALFGATLFTTYRWLADDPTPGFLSSYLMAFASFAIFAMIDLLVVDWFVICFWTPAWVMIPGTEDCAGWHDYRFHFTEQFSPRGIAALLLTPIPAAAIALLLH